MPKVNMRDVALHAGVSVATVSHVINDTRYVSQETRQRVESSIRALDYSPNAMGRILKTGRKNLVGCIVPDIANNFFSTIIEEAEGVLGAQDYRLIVANTKETKNREESHIRALGSGIVDGLIIASTMERYEELQRLVPDNLPVVFIDRSLPGCPHDTITISNHESVYRGVEALIQEGHSRIGYITGLMRLSTTSERLSAYQDAMAAYSLPVEEGFIQYGDSMSKSAVKGLDKLLDYGCTALVVSNNVMADDVLYYLYEHDMKIGRDVSILGYDDSDRINYNMRRMHMVSQPTKQLGRRAGEQMLARLADPAAPIKNIVLNAIFVPRSGMTRPANPAV